MSDNAFQYKGHRVEISVSVDSKGNWRWSFTVDGLDYTEMCDRPIPGYELALMEAAQEAKQRIDAKK
ncbi:hypothetical protein [Duganella callida]|uniref:DUF1508 domain-containing protein n=1 Tax=Duganella callida TaxID=2561932 RepID=A0A4Y9S3P6_9BURK|nr:hypothetical protein [Duganella callida]TFW15940.1 hypothetical protein E4L98_24915 [Duganella callida]